MGYGDVSPQTVAGRWLTVFFLPFAVVFVGSQMNAIGDLFSGSNAEGAMEKMLKLDLSAEVRIQEHAHMSPCLKKLSEKYPV